MRHIIYLSLIIIACCNNSFSQGWIGKSIEYKSICLEVYKNATKTIDTALKDRLWSAELSQMGKEDIWDKKTAIIMDIDETILDNSDFFQLMEARDTSFDEQLWIKWVADAKASAVVGAVDFIKYAESKGIEIFYITNRDCSINDSIKCPEQEQTLLNLKKLALTQMTITC